jgi:hypothetical protein
MNSVGIRNRRLQVIAGILMLTAGVFNILWLIGVFTHVLDVKALLRATAIISPFPYLILDIGFGGNNFVASLLAVVFILGILISIIGGCFALQRKNRGMALVGAAGACICAPLLGIAAVITTLMFWKRISK